MVLYDLKWTDGTFQIYDEQKSQVGQVGEVGCILFSINIFSLVSHPVAPHTTRGEL